MVLGSKQPMDTDKAKSIAANSNRRSIHFTPSVSKIAFASEVTLPIEIGVKVLKMQGR